MNHAAGLAANGDLIVLTSGWSNRWPPDVPRTRGSYRYEVLGPWLSRSLDGGYPSSVQRIDGQVITAYYCSALPGDPPDSYQNYRMAVIAWDPEQTFSKE